MSAEEPAEPKAVKHTLDAPGSPPAAKKARAEDLKTEDTLADAEESAAAAPPAGGDVPEPAEPAPDAGGDDAGSEAGEAPGDASEGGTRRRVPPARPRPPETVPLHVGEPPAPDAAGAAAAAVAAASGALAPSSPDGMPRPGMGVMAAPPMAPMAQYTLQALAGRTIEFKVLLPNAKCGIVIGKGGAMIKHIRETSKAQVDVSEAQAVAAHVAAAQGGAGLAAERVVSFSGDFGAVYAAFQMVLSHIVANSPAVVDALGVAMPAVGGVVEAVVLVPRNKTGGLIGRAGASINRVRQDSGATVKVGAPEDVVVGDPDVRKCVVSGSIDQVMGAFTLIVHKLEETPAGAARAPEMGGMGMPGYGMAVPGMPPGQFPPGGPGGPGGPGMAPPLAPGTMPVQFQVPNESMGAVRTAARDVTFRGGGDTSLELENNPLVQNFSSSNRRRCARRSDALISTRATRGGSGAVRK